MRLRWVCLSVALSGCRPTGDTLPTVTVERGDLVIDVDVSGTLEAVDSQRVGPPGISGVWNYKIAMLAAEGEEVAQDQPVLMFDTTDLQRRLDEKKAERDSAATQLQLERAAAKVARQDEALALAEAQAELHKAELKAEVPANLASTIEIEKAALDLQLARDKVAYLQRKSESAAKRDQAEISRWRSKRDRAQERVEEFTRAIAQMTVGSPRAGTVIHETNWQGEKKKVGDSAWRAETILHVVSLDAMKAEGVVDEVDISKLDVGQVVSLRLDARADVELQGQVREISRTVQQAAPENPLKIVKLDIGLDERGDVKLRPGMRFRGSIQTEQIDDALLVPLDALFPTADGPVARRVSTTGVEVVPVKLGQRNDTHAIVLEGLEEGDDVMRVQEAAP